MLDELRALAIFAKVVEIGSLRGAARTLSLSPSVVSHHVRTLEQRLGVTLLHRSTRKLALTPAGERLFAEANAMTMAAERGLDEARGLSTAPSGALRLTMPAFLADTSLCHDIAEFARAHPRVSLTLGFSEVPRDLLDDRFDLALRMGKLDESSHRTRQLAHMRRVLVTAPELRASLRSPRGLDDLATWPVVHLGSRAPTFRLEHQTRREATQLSYTPALTVDNAAAMRSLVLAGAGLATLPEVLVRDDLARGAMVELLPEWRVEPIPVHAVWPNGTVKATLTLRFLDFIGPRVAALFTVPSKRMHK